MSELDSRLTALDPAAGAPYEHRDIESLIARITATPAVAPRRWWKNLEVKLAAFLVAGSLVVAGSLAIVEGTATVLPSLALAQHHATFAPTASRSLGAMEVSEEFDFHASTALSDTTPASPSYELSVPSDGASESVRVASVFGVTGTPVDTNGNGSDWTVSDASGASLDYQNSGVPQWYYSSSSPKIAPATQSDTASGPVPSETTLAGDVQRYLDELGYGYTVASPDFGTSTISDTNSSGGPVSVSTADVTYSVVVNGVSTDQTLNFSVNADNSVVYASGPALRVGTPVNYPLQSPLAGVAALNAAQHAKYASSSSTPPLVNATLTGDQVQLATYQLADGSLWFLPIYNYSGDVTNTTGTDSSGTWNELAIDPSYLQSGSGSAVVNRSNIKF
jgi:hypothetical protein